MAPRSRGDEIVIPWRRTGRTQRGVLRRSFGEGVFETFMYPHNPKVWVDPPAQVGVGWMGERVAPVDLARILTNLVRQRDDVSWGA